MIRLTRMEVTLGCLIASMTLGAAVLDWSQPDRPLANLSSTELIARHVENAMGSANQDQPNQHTWQSIRISPTWADSLDQADDKHLIIDSHGEYNFQPSFQKHQRLAGQPGVIQIGVTVSRQNTKLTAVQQRVTMSLIQALQKKCNIPDARVSCDKQLALASSRPANR